MVGGFVKSAKIATDVTGSGTRLIADGFGKIDIGRDLIDSLILAGGNLGVKHELGGADDEADRYSTGQGIAGLKVKRNVVNSSVVAGVVPTNLFFGDGDDKGLPGVDGRGKPIGIGSVDIAGTITNDGTVPGSFYGIVASFIGKAKLGRTSFKAADITEAGLVDPAIGPNTTIRTVAPDTDSPTVTMADPDGTVTVFPDMVFDVAFTIDELLDPDSVTAAMDLITVTGVTAGSVDGGGRVL